MTILTRLLYTPLPRLAVLLTTLILTSLGATGATVFKSVDADGTVRYSDKPPADGGAIEEIDLPDRSPVTVPDTASLVEQMAATTKRLQDDRLEREKARQPAPKPQPIYYPQPEQKRQYHSQPWPWGYDAPPYRQDHRHRQRPQREPPDLRNERDRNRDAKEGTWYVPQRLPAFSPSRR